MPLVLFVLATLPLIWSSSQHLASLVREINIPIWTDMVSAVHSLLGSVVLETLHCTALHYTVQYFTASYCTVLYWTLLLCNVCTTLHCTTLHCTAQHCTVLHCTALHCTTIHCTVMPCPTAGSYGTSISIFLTSTKELGPGGEWSELWSEDEGRGRMRGEGGWREREDEVEREQEWWETKNEG